MGCNAGINPYMQHIGGMPPAEMAGGMMTKWEWLELLDDNGYMRCLEIHKTIMCIDENSTGDFIFLGIMYDYFYDQVSNLQPPLRFVANLDMKIVGELEKWQPAPNGGINENCK